ncbi:MAG: ABC transporter ATP-binding protein [Desulfuromonadaceae bacterium]|nr:ABC transporter ATP-binding protein [Desulfuromonadaceae bacterium]
MTKLLEVNGICKSFAVSPAPGQKSQRLQAVDDVSFSMLPGETLGLVGESGCGKSTLAKLLMGLLEPDRGAVHFQGLPLSGLSRRQRRPLLRKVQMIFQDPYASLNPRMNVEAILSEPYIIHNRPQDAGQGVQQLLDAVGLPQEARFRFPHEFSGGQRQRIGIARALALKPDLIIADEPVSALDLSIQAQILDLLRELQQQYQLSYLLISHDLSVIRELCQRVAVMYLGRLVEIAPVSDFFHRPRHPYSEMLLKALPIADPRHPQHALPAGEIPSALAPPAGCSFHPRCPYREQECQTSAPALTSLGNDHFAACHVAEKLFLDGLST